MNLPNKLTILRIILMPVMVILFYLNMPILAAIVFILASITDLLDGKIARRNNIVTTFGKFVDPLADKLINIAALIILSAGILQKQQAWYGIFAVITTLVIVSREVIITSFRALASSEGLVIAADKLGKIKTVVQDVAIVGMFLDESKYVNMVPFLNELVHWTTILALTAALILTIVSGINYFTSNKTIVEKLKTDI